MTPYDMLYAVYMLKFLQKWGIVCTNLFLAPALQCVTHFFMLCTFMFKDFLIVHGVDSAQLPHF